MHQILGHERPLSVLRAAMRGGRMHHAWMLHGPVGVGKYTAALAVAKVLLCHAAKNESSEACDRCASCRLFTPQTAAGDGEPTPEQNAHPDLHVIYKELAAVSEFSELRKKKQMNIPIDLLRETMVGGWIDGKYIDSAVGKKPMMNHGKIFIIDEAELLDATGQNSLLKTLEEPPPNTYIFLITSHEDRLLPTIRSRCQRVPFSPLDDAMISGWLDSRGTGAALSAAQRAWVVRFARGSLGRALLAIEYRLDAWAAEIGPMIDKLAAGRAAVELGPTMAELVGVYAEAWVKAHKGASKDAANKAGARHMLGLLGEICRQRLRDAAAKADPADPVTAENAAHFWLAGIDLLQVAEQNLESNVNLALLLDHMAIQWSDSLTPSPS